MLGIWVEDIQHPAHVAANAVWSLDVLASSICQTALPLTSPLGVRPRVRQRSSSPLQRALGAQSFPSKESFPASIYRNPLNPAKYVVPNTGLTIEDRGYNGDYGTPLWGDYAIVKVKPGAAVPDMLTAGLFDEHWQLPK